MRLSPVTRALAVLICAAILTAATGLAWAAEGAAPVEGPWYAETSAGLPVSFKVEGGKVADLHFKFKWGFCGTFSSGEGQGAAIEAGGRWSYADSRGPSIEATFTGPESAEGKVSVVERETPGCPHTEATFTAAPGEAPAGSAKPRALVTDSVVSGHLSSRPHAMTLAADGTFYLSAINWQSFGGPVARGRGIAYVRGCTPDCARGQVRRPRVSIRLDHVVSQGRKRVYSRLHFVLHGRVPSGYRHRGTIPLL